VAGFSKYDPNRPVDEPGKATTPGGARRALILRWVNWITLLYTALGFGFIVYWIAKGN
jgi:hypothetical protein